LTDTKSQQAVASFFRQRLTPAAEQLGARQVEFFPLGPDSAESWYIPYPADAPEFETLENTQCFAQLQALWISQGLPELAALCAPLAELSASLAAEEPFSDDVSPFIYQMF